jgi:tetraacyldisaccharide 4'-kinase
LIERLWQRPLPAPLWPLSAALIPASILYSGVLKLRQRWWHTRATAAGVTTVSVGNLSVGGNGKTPFTLFLASRLRERGLAVGIISRGWGRKGNAAALVSDGIRILMSPREAGDEPVMMAKSFPGPIAVARRRIDAARMLSARIPLGVFVLDDGFQHLRLHRDLNLLLINARRGFGNGWVLPAGPLREPRDAIARADAIVLIDSGATDETPPTLLNFALPDRIPILHASIRPHAMVLADATGWHEHPLALSGMRVAAVSGLADSTDFHAMLARLGATLVATLDFPDHHGYTPYDFENILSVARNADRIVTTEKDLVKLERFPQSGISIYALKLAVSMNASDEAQLFDLVTDKIRLSSRIATPSE